MAGRARFFDADERLKALSAAGERWSGCLWWSISRCWSMFPNTGFPYATATPLASEACR